MIESSIINDYALHALMLKLLDQEKNSMWYCGKQTLFNGGERS